MTPETSTLPNPFKIFQDPDPNFKAKETAPWYADGLRFKCTECGGCCSGGPGYTWVTDKDIFAISAYLKMDPIPFVKKYVRSVDGNLALIENVRMERDDKGEEIYDCVFLKDNRCQVYPVRPTQCRTFPWWTQNLKSPEAWQEAASRCEGISETAPVVDFQTIEGQSQQEW